MLFLVNDNLLEGSVDPQELFEVFLKENGLIYPGGPLEAWLEKRQEILERLNPLDKTFVKWLKNKGFQELEYRSVKIFGS